MSLIFLPRLAAAALFAVTGLGIPAAKKLNVVTTTPEATALMERFRELNQRQLRELLTRLAPDELDIVDRSLEVLGRAIDRTVTTIDQEIPS